MDTRGDCKSRIGGIFNSELSRGLLASLLNSCLNIVPGLSVRKFAKPKESAGRKDAAQEKSQYRII